MANKRTTAVRKPAKKALSSIPKIVKKSGAEISKEFGEFPVRHYSYSSFVNFTENPFTYKVKYINGDSIDSAINVSSVLGSSAHKGFEAYFNAFKDGDTQAAAKGLIAAEEHLDSYSDGIIKYSKTIENRTKLIEKLSYGYFSYLKESSFINDIKEILAVEKMLIHKVIIDGKELPIPIKGSADLIYRDKQGRIIIRDHKLTSRFSPDEDIDAPKLVQAAFNYFLTAAEFGEAPYSITFAECKISENQDKKIPQVKEYTIVYSELPLIFDLFYRLYTDITDAHLGKQVFIPNLRTMFDKDVSIIAYIHKLDVDSDKERQFKNLRVDNITDFIKAKLEKSGAAKKYLDTVAKNFVSARTLKYEDMTTEDRIKMKLAEHGIQLDFDSKIIGSAITLYRYMPSIGVKMSKIESFTKDIEQAVGVADIRILAPIPDSELVGFEVKNKERYFPESKAEADGFNLAIGINVMGETVRTDIRNAPHMLVGGSTGSGKSVFMGTMIRQLLELDNTVLFLMDPKKVELKEYSGKENVRYYASAANINVALRELVEEMDSRYDYLADNGYKSVTEYNNNSGKKIPYIFCFIDEFADLKTGENGKEIEATILVLAQKSRAAGIHIVLATQRPSVKIISGDIKANFPTRVAFNTSSAVDSMVILDQQGAEKLLGRGDMLFMTPKKNGLERLQGFNL